MNYYYVDANNQAQGPLTAQQIMSLLAAGQLTSNSLICPEGGQEWITLSAAFPIAPPISPDPALPPAVVAPKQKTKKKSGCLGTCLTIIFVLFVLWLGIGLIVPALTSSHDETRSRESSATPRGAPSSEVVKKVLKYHLKFGMATSAEVITKGFDSVDFEKTFSDMEQRMDIVYGDTMKTVGDTNVFMSLGYYEKLTDELTQTGAEKTSFLDSMSAGRRIPAGTKVYPVKITTKNDNGKTSTYRLIFCQTADGEWLFNVGN